MTAAALRLPVLRTAAGEPPLGRKAEFFRDDQGEIFEHDNPRYRSGATKIGVIELDNGKWLAQPPSFHVVGPQHACREAALRAGIAMMVRRARKYRRNKGGEGTQWTDGFAGRVIEWAIELKPARALTDAAVLAWLKSILAEPPDHSTCPTSVRESLVGMKLIMRVAGAPGEYDLTDAGLRRLGLEPVDSTEEIDPPANAANELGPEPVREEITPPPDYWMHAGDDAEQLTRDPVVRQLVEAHRLRKAFPAKHIFSMTSAVDDGRIVSIATCDCKHVIKFGSNDQQRMNAAIEAHYRRFAHGPMVDGRGQPLKPGDGSQIPHAAKTRKKKADNSAGGDLLSAPTGESQDGRPTKDSRDADGRADRTGQGDGEQGARNDGTAKQGRAARTRQQARAASASGAPAPASEGTRVGEAAPIGAGAEPWMHPAAANHVITNSRDYQGDEIFSVATCPCGWTFRVETFPDGARLRDDAVEAHWREIIEAAPNGGGDQFSSPAMADGEVSAVAGAPTMPVRPDDGLHAGEIAPVTNPALADNFGYHDLLDIEEGFDAGEWNNVAAHDAADPSPPTPLPQGERGEEAAGTRPVPSMSPEPCKPAPVSAASTGEQQCDTTGVTGGESAATLSDEDDLAIDWPSYDGFLEDKIVTAPLRGIEVARDALHPWLKPHCRDLVVWSLRLGCAAIFASFGLHKTAMQLEWTRQLVKHTGSPSLSVVPLGVRHGFIKEAAQLGMDVRFVRTEAEFDDLCCEGVRHFLTNYESIREGKLDPNLFEAVTLDEASCLRSYGSKTFQEFLPLFAKVPFKLVATATPSPNRYKELIHYAGFLGVMDTGLALTRWFQRNSEKAGDLTLYPHKEDEFWMWVHSWAAFLQKPSELGHSDVGYELPPLKLTWHEVPADHSKAQPDRDGQSVMFRAVAASLSDAAKARRDSLGPRIGRMMDIIARDPESTYLIWHDLEAEREAIEAALPGVVTITGSGMSIEAREARLHDFEEGRTQYFATKPTLSGSGSNFQYHCHKAVYVALPGYGYKFNDFIQSLYRLQRFGQTRPVEIDIIYSEDERSGRAALEEKWARDGEMRARMSEIIRRHGLDTLPMRDALRRTIGVKRVEVKGERFVAINNDAVAECRTWPDNSVDQIITSIPFGNQYEYSASYHDFGHSDDSAHFWQQMDFLTSDLLRILKPGRLACIHVKDRVLFGAVTGEGVPTISPFHAEAIMHYRAHGLQYLGMITVVTDVVRENNQTYRLGWSENAKDGTKMGVGSPEYILLMRKAQSDRSRSYADVPVTKSKDDYTRARWQVDAHAFWRSSGNRHLTPEEFSACSAADLARLFAKTTVARVYDYEAHVRIGETVDRTGTLPSTFMAIAPGSHCDEVWHDINRMRTLNMMQQRKGAEMHLCPLQFDIVDRLIERYSNPDDLIFDPFGGLMTVPYRAILKGRRGAATELSASYFLDGVKYLQMAEERMTTPALFDLMAFDNAVTTPGDVTEAETHV